MKKILFALSIVLPVFLIMADASYAINYDTGAKLAPGFYLDLYPYWYSADKQTDKNGNVVSNDLGMDKYGVLFSGSYYTDHFLMNVVVPVGGLRINALQSGSGGLGDVYLRGGWFLPVKCVTLLPALAVKIPAGNFSSNDKVNFGDGQTDIQPELYLNKTVGSFTIDWLWKYAFRLENHDTGYKPGNEFDTEGLITYGITDRLRIGPSGAFVSGVDNEQYGRKAAYSGIKKLSLGGELDYRVSPSLSISFAVLKDVNAKNTVEGTLVMSRIAIRF